MARVRVHNFSLSLDGFGAGPDQTREVPLGEGGERLHDWMFRTRMWASMTGDPDGGETGVDDDLASAGDDGVGATIMGRNMFGPIRGPWTDEDWRGWWGDEPPYHHPVFVLTHHAHAPIPMAGGTTFHFVTDGIAAALERATEAAAGRDVRIGGGVSTIRQYLVAGLIDDLHLPVSPIVLGRGERLLDGDDVAAALDAISPGPPTLVLGTHGDVVHVRYRRP